MAESLHQGLAQWIQCKLGKQYLWKKVTLPWELNPGPTPNRGDLATLVASVGLKKKTKKHTPDLVGSDKVGHGNDLVVIFVGLRLLRVKGIDPRLHQHVGQH